MENYTYVTEDLDCKPFPHYDADNPNAPRTLKDIYKLLGPFDFSLYPEQQDDDFGGAQSAMSDEMDDRRIPQRYWDTRKSGA